MNYNSNQNDNDLLPVAVPDPEVGLIVDPVDRQAAISNISSRNTSSIIVSSSLHDGDADADNAKPATASKGSISKQRSIRFQQELTPSMSSILPYDDATSSDLKRDQEASKKARNNDSGHDTSLTVLDLVEDGDDDEESSPNMDHHVNGDGDDDGDGHQKLSRSNNDSSLSRFTRSTRKMRTSMHNSISTYSDRAFTNLFGDRHQNTKESAYVIIAGGLLALNSGVVNGTCLSGFLTPNSEQQSVAGFTSMYTGSALALAGGDLSLYRKQTFIILSYMLGSFISGFISPNATPYQVEPLYGPTFMIGALFLFGASLLAALEQDAQYIFYLASAANGIQNGIASIYSANLVRCSLTGSSTDIALTMAQLLRGNNKNLWKGIVLAIIVTNFWLGGLISFYLSQRFLSYTLLFNAGLFLLVGVSLVWFLVVEVGISVQAAIFGTWKWKKVLGKIHTSMLNEIVDDGKEVGTTVSSSVGAGDSKLELTKMALLQLFDHIDTDGSGAIDSDELLEALVKANVKMSAYEIKTLFKAADDNQDGEISKEEWEVLVSKMMKDGPAESTKKRKKKVRARNPSRVRG